MKDEDFIRYDLESNCDDCGRPISLINYYNQDGLCSKCFIKWINKE